MSRGEELYAMTGYPASGRFGESARTALLGPSFEREAEMPVLVPYARTWRQRLAAWFRLSPRD